MQIRRTPMVRVPDECSRCGRWGTVNLQRTIESDRGVLVWRCIACNAEWPVRDNRKIPGRIRAQFRNERCQTLKSQAASMPITGVKFRVPPRCPECSELGSVRLQAVIRRGAATVYWGCRVCHAEWPVRPTDYLERRIGSKERGSTVRSDRRRRS